MNKKTLTLIGFAAIIAAVAAFLQAATPKESGEGKFHVVYLVSAIDLKPGSKAFVDPVFFTDGKQIKPFHDYCRAYGKEQGVSTTDLKPGQIGDAIGPIHRYCKNQPIPIEDRQYHTLNNSGVSVRLGTIEFTPGAKDGTIDGHQLIPRTRPYPGVTAIESVAGTPPAIELDTDSAIRPRHFFLMSTNRALLEKIVPVQRYEVAQMKKLLDRARVFAEEIKGRKRSRQTMLIDGQLQTKIIEKKRPPTFDTSVKPLLLDALFADIDGDKEPDAIVGVSVVWIGAESRSKYRWQASLSLLSTSGDSFSAGYDFPGGYEGQLAHGYSHGPRALLRVGPCSYLLGASSHGILYTLGSLPQPTKTCLSQGMFREGRGLFGESP